MARTNTQNDDMSILPCFKTWRQLLSTFCYTFQSSIRQLDCSGSIRRYFNSKVEAAIDELPIRRNTSVHRRVSCFDVSESAARMRPNQNMLVTRGKLIDVDSCYHFIHPITHRTIGVMVEGVH